MRSAAENWFYSGCSVLGVAVVAAFTGSCYGAWDLLAIALLEMVVGSVIWLVRDRRRA